MVSYFFLISGTIQDPTPMNLPWEVSLGLFLQHVLEAGHASCVGSDPVPCTSIYFHLLRDGLGHGLIAHLPARGRSFSVKLKISWKLPFLVL